MKNLAFQLLESLADTKRNMEKTNRANADTHADTHKHLTKFGWEMGNVDKEAPLVSTLSYRHPKFPEHEIKVKNLDGHMRHHRRFKNEETGYRQEVITSVPAGSVKTYLQEFDDANNVDDRNKIS